jgi:3-hydroxybutyryl-CoA dehydrogenase
MKNIAKVGIIGAGTMGRRIAYGCIIGGKETLLYDLVPEAMAQALEAVRTMIKDRIGRGVLPKTTLKRALSLLTISPTLKDCVSGVDLAIETVTENIEIKRKVFAAVDKLAPPDALIGSNTSSIPSSKLAGATERPEKVFDFNWSSPDDLKVEVMGNPLTDPQTIEAVVRFVRDLGLIPIVVRKEILGYATNRVWRAVKKEVLSLLDKGHITPEDMDRAWMLDWGTEFGPCGLMDIVGLDVIRDIEMIYFQASADPSDQPPELLLDMIAQGKLGVKSGEGFYKYPDPAYKRQGWLRGEET